MSPRGFLGVISAAQLAHFAFQLGDPLLIPGHVGARTLAAVDFSTCFSQSPKASG